MFSSAQSAAVPKGKNAGVGNQGARERFWAFWLVCADIALLGLLVVLTVATDLVGLSAAWAVGAGDITFIVLILRGRYSPRLRTGFFEEVRFTATATAIALPIIVGLQAVTEDGVVSLEPGLRYWALSTVFLTAGRLVMNLVGTRTGMLPASGVPTLIVGAGRVGHLVAKRLQEQPSAGLRPVGFLDKQPRDEGESSDLPVMGASWDLERIAGEHGIGYVIVTFSTAPTDVLLSLIRRCEEMGIGVALVPRLFEVVRGRLHIEHLGGLPILEVQPADPAGWKFAVKHVLDRVFALIMLPFLLPILALCGAAVLCSLGRPVFFRQRRVGRDGKEFEIFKFRSMGRADNGQETSVVDRQIDTAPGGVEGPDRRTRVGRLLRKSSFDELPQIFNVLKGEMSFIGPRPERPEFAEVFEQDVYRYGARHRVKSGITGWSQVNGLRGKTSISDRAEWDNYYIENWSFGLDLKIILMTISTLFNHSSVE